MKRIKPGGEPAKENENMMKKWLTLVFLLLILGSLPAIASAAVCSEHPNAGTTVKWSAYRYERNNGKSHYKVRDGQVCCKTCGKVLETRQDKKAELHTAQNGVCSKCGYQLTESEAQQEAYRRELLKKNMQLGEKAVGLYAKARWGTNVHERPDLNSFVLGMTQAGKQYTILGYQDAGPSAAYFQIQFGDQIGWTAVDRADVVDYYVPEDGVCEKHIGCVIRMKSEYKDTVLRAEPSQKASIVYTLKNHNEYTVLECQINDQGRHWFKIRVGNKEGWTASGRYEITYPEK